MESAQLNKFASVLLVLVAATLLFGVWRLAVDVAPATLPWIVALLVATFTAACLFACAFLEFAAKPTVAMMATMFAICFAAGNFVLQLSGRSLVDIVDAKLFARLTMPVTTAPVASSRGDFPDLDPNLPYDDRTVAQVVQDLKGAGFQLNAFYNPGVLYRTIDLNLMKFPLFPLSGPSNKFPGPNNVAVYCTEGRQHDWPIYRKDRYGFNNDDIVFSHKDLYLLIGGSFAQGSCVHQDETVQSLLTRRGYPTFVAAIGGLGALSAVASLKEYGEPLKPKVVLWQFYDPNDIDLLPRRELRSPTLIDYLRDDFSQDLIHRQDEVDAIYADISRWEPRVTEIEKDKEYGTAWEQMLDTNLPRVRELLGNDINSLRDDDDLLTVYERIMSLADKRIRSWGGRLYLVLFPNEDVYTSGAVPKYRRRIVGYAQKNGIGVIDPDPALRQSGDPLQFFAERQGWSHLNPAGYALTTREIIARLQHDPPRAAALAAGRK